MTELSTIETPCTDADHRLLLLDDEHLLTCAPAIIERARALRTDDERPLAGRTVLVLTADADDDGVLADIALRAGGADVLLRRRSGARARLLPSDLAAMDAAVDLIVTVGVDQQLLVALARLSAHPVLNLESERFAPLRNIADAIVIAQHSVREKGSATVAYVGWLSEPGARGFHTVAAALGIDVRDATPAYPGLAEHIADADIVFEGSPSGRSRRPITVAMIDDNGNRACRYMRGAPGLLVDWPGDERSDSPANSPRCLAPDQIDALATVLVAAADLAVTGRLGTGVPPVRQATANRRPVTATGTTRM